MAWVDSSGNAAVGRQRGLGVEGTLGAVDHCRFREGQRKATLKQVVLFGAWQARQSEPPMVSQGVAGGAGYPTGRHFGPVPGHEWTW